MSRTARLQSSTNIYHVMFRGINHQEIFWEDEDYRKFLYILQDCKKVDGFKLYAYCLMGNHVHLLIEVCDTPLSDIMKRIGCKFVFWYNTKYERTGHLFQDRFRSEIIVDDNHFMRVLRYILQNPLKAGIVSAAEMYEWSSFSAYKGRSDYVTDVIKAITIIGGRNKFLAFADQQNSDECIDIADSFRMTDKKAMEMIKKLAGFENPYEVQNMEKSAKKNFIMMLHRRGISIRRISRLCGISKPRVEGMLKG